MSNSKLAAIAWQSGLIEFVNVESPPSGSMVIAVAGIDGPSDDQAFKDAVSVKARHSRTSDEIFVPGVSELEDQLDAVQRLYEWCDWAFGSEPMMILEAQ